MTRYQPTVTLIPYTTLFRSNNGVIELISQDQGFTENLIITNGTLVNAVGGRIDALQGTGGGRFLNAQFDNRGSINVSNRSEEHTSELQSLRHLACRLILDIS